MSGFNSLPSLSHAFLLLFLFICYFCCFYIIRNEDAAAKTQHSEQQTEKSQSLKSNITKNDGGFCDRAMMTSECQSRHIEYKNVYLIDVGVQGMDLNASNRRMSCDNVYIVQYGQDGFTEIDKFFENEAEKGNKLVLKEHLIIGENKNINNSGYTVIKCRSGNKRHALKESDVPFSNKLTKELPRKYREKKENYYPGKIRPQGNSLSSLSNDGFIRIFFLSLLKLHSFNEFIYLAKKCVSSNFLNALAMIRKEIYMENIYSVSPSFLEVVTKAFNKINNTFGSSMDLSQINLFYRKLLACFFRRRCINKTTITKFFFMVVGHSQRSSFFKLGVLSDKDFVDYKISNVKKIKKYKSGSSIKLLRAPKIFLFVPENTVFSYHNKFFSELLLNEYIYSPKSFILKTRNYSGNQEYYTCLLKSDNKTWVILDERGGSRGKLKRGVFQYEIEICVIFYENYN